jgi:acyl-CoA reductase-like NAD-dependent aldehyde dehydrogenase
MIAFVDTSTSRVVSHQAQTPRTPPSQQGGPHRRETFDALSTQEKYKVTQAHDMREAGKNRDAKSRDMDVAVTAELDRRDPEWRKLPAEKRLFIFNQVQGELRKKA